MAQNAAGGGDQNFDYMFKLLIIGNSSVGKTSFLFRYCDDSFTSAFVSTVGIDFKVKTVFRGDKRVKLQIWVNFSEIFSFIHENLSKFIVQDLFLNFHFTSNFEFLFIFLFALRIWKKFIVAKMVLRQKKMIFWFWNQKNFQNRIKKNKNWVKFKNSKLCFAKI